MSDLMIAAPGDGIYVKVIKDSISEHSSDRVTTFEVRTHRFTLAEWNTHSVFVRNSASSRAIPVTKQLKRYYENPALPVEWASEKPGMQGGPPLEGDDLEDALNLWGIIHDFTAVAVKTYLDDHPLEEEGDVRLHKSLLNRLLEPMQWHTMVITASSYDNFFFQRADAAAMPEFRVCAEMMQELYLKSVPVEMSRGDWHLPYVDDDEQAFLKRASIDAREISTARCARVSYETQDGKRDFSKDLELYHDRLLKNNHWSPFAHIATPQASNAQWVDVYDPDRPGSPIAQRRLPRMGHFLGWQEWRHVVEARTGYTSYR